MTALNVTGSTLPIFSQAWSDALQVRMQQVEKFGHDATADDARGAAEIMREVAANIQCVQSMLIGDPRKLTPQEQVVMRRRALRALALGFAALDTLDRALAVRQ